MVSGDGNGRLLEGWLPVRIRTKGGYALDGKLLDGPGREVGPLIEDEGLQVHEIKKVTNGGWYPTKMVHRYYLGRQEDFRGGQMRERIAGTAPPVRAVLDSESTLEVELVEAGREFGSFSIPLPEGTHILDYTQGGARVVGHAQDKLQALVPLQSLPGAVAPQGLSWWILLAVGNLLLLALLVGAFWRRRRRRLAAGPS